MADKTSKAQASRISNIMDRIRGNFDFKIKEEDSKGPVSYGSEELISREVKTKILNGAYNVIANQHGNRSAGGSILNLTQKSLTNIGKDRMENRKILQLMPEVSKAARLMIASILSPNDLSRHQISITFDCEGIEEHHKLKLEKAVSDFFQKKLNLKTALPNWIYQFGYETGSCVFAVIPMYSFAKIHDDSYIGSESLFTKTVIDPISQETIFGFSDSAVSLRQESDSRALESFIEKTIIESSLDDDDLGNVTSGGRLKEGYAKSLAKAFLGQESLNLTDNPSILQVSETAKEKRKNRAKDSIKRHFNRIPKASPMLSIEAPVNDKGEHEVLGDPILMRIPSEAVTVIHTPGDPNDHQGYFVLLDQTGSPINAATIEEALQAGQADYNQIQSNIFNQSYSAYGLDSGFRGISDRETMTRVYSQIVQHHLLQRLDKSGFGRVETSKMEPILRCMFGRFLQQKQTRILFLPKELVTYMAFELDQNGVGVSRLDGIKFNLGMKMAVQVARVLASIKAATDNRKIEIKVDENLMENPESIIQTVIEQFQNKNRMSFTTDPNLIQQQIVSKSLSIKATGAPGMETFDVTNEPDSKTGAVDFDPSILEYMDGVINNGLRVPAAAMNSLGENEYSRSVVTTNLFFAADVGIDQDIVIKHASDLIRIYARHSDSFLNAISKVIPNFKNERNNGTNSTDEARGSKAKQEDIQLPEGFSIDTLIDSMLISLPKPNVAPSKAQFESLEAMSTAIAAMVQSLFPDDLMGSDESLRPVVAALRARFVADNVRAYLESSGMTMLKVPDDSFSSEIKSMTNVQKSLHNLRAQMDEETKLSTPPVPADGTSVDGYA